jgi:hypothetical protein
MENVLDAPTSHAESGSKALVWTGRIISALVAAFLLLDAVMKLAMIAPVIEGSTRLGFAITTIRPMGAVLLIATLLYAVPRTATLGALLVTAYLGGATATMVRAGEPFWFPVAVGIMAWAGLLLRQPRLRALVLSLSS